MGEEKTVRSTVVIGVDFGTLSGRALVVRAADGAELGSAVHEYRARRRGAPPARDRRGAAAGVGAAGPETTATSCATRSRRRSRAPASRPSRSSASPPTSPRRRRCRRWPTARRCASCRSCDDRPHAYVKLWKHHAAQAHADRINELAAERGEPWLARYGGRISIEWEFAKALQLLEEDPEVYERTERWIEAADWIVWQLCGRETRNTCTAGFKGI